MRSRPTPGRIRTWPRHAELHPHVLANLSNDEAIGHEHERARELSGEAYQRSRRVRGDEHRATLAAARVVPYYVPPSDGGSA